jgi:L-ascorbate metabolism protein UlaG (beta-lactamase superfamily)
MELQFFGANCIVLSTKGVRIVIDDTLESLGAKSIIKPDDVALFTSSEHEPVKSRLMFDSPGEYEVSDISIVGIASRSHMDESESNHTTTMYKIIIGEIRVLITGHIHPDISDSLLEKIGTIDVLVIPVGGSGYTLDPVGAIKVIKEIEPKLIIPTHYDEKDLNYPVPQVSLDNALKELGMEPKERVTKLRIKPGELSEVTQLVILERS